VDRKLPSQVKLTEILWTSVKPEDGHRGAESQVPQDGLAYTYRAVSWSVLDRYDEIFCGKVYVAKYGSSWS